MNFFDMLIEIVSPSRALERLKAREEIKRRYRAAKNSNAMGSWNPARRHINNEIRNSHHLLTSRLMELIRDFPPFSSALNVMSDFFIGSGFACDPNFKNEQGDLLDDINKEVKDKWDEFCDKDNFDVNGKLSFYEFLRLIVRTEGALGESLFLKKYNPLTDQNPLQIQAIDPLTLVENKLVGMEEDKDNYYRGIRYYGETTRPKYYYFSKNTYDNDFFSLQTEDDYERIEAKYIVHNYQALDVNQLRGVTPFHSSIIYGKILEDYLESEVVNQKSAAKVAMIIKNMRPHQTKADQTLAQQNMDSLLRRLDVGQVEYLSAGEELQFNQATRNAASFESFDQNLLQKISSSLGLPYELISGDYQKLNYSLLRGKRNDFLFSLKNKWALIVQNICTPIFQNWLFFQIMSSKITSIRMEEFLANRKAYTCKWRTPGLPPVDQYKENKANIEAIQAGIQSPIGVIEGDGNDWQEVLEDRKIFEDRVNDLGITILYNQNEKKTDDDDDDDDDNKKKEEGKK